MNPHVGVIFVLPATPETVRVNGIAELTADPELLERLAARGKPALLAIRVHVEECFHHCAKAFIRSELWKPETWHPEALPSHARIVKDVQPAKETLAELEQYYGPSYLAGLYGTPPRS